VEGAVISVALEDERRFQGAVDARHIVANQLKIFIPVGTAIIIVAAVK
jgi:hypothetical protein